MTAPVAVPTGTTVRDKYPTRVSTEPQLMRRQDPVMYGSEDDGPMGAEDLAGFDRDGFLAIDQLVTPDEVERYRDETRRLGADPGLRADDRTIVEPGSDEVRSVFDVHKLSDVFADLVSDPRIVGRARQILGGDVYVHQSRVNHKQGLGGRGFYWHSDFETWHAEDGMPAMRAFSVSIALTDSYATNGALMIMPGSHRTFVSCMGETPEDHYRQSLRQQEVGTPDPISLTTLADQHGITQLLGGPGSATMFDGNCMHGSSDNITPFPRSNIFIVFNSMDNTLVEPYRAPDRRPEFIASRDFTPVRLCDMALRLHDDDNVGLNVGPDVAPPGEPSVPGGHKVALADIPEGAPVRKYGQVIGYASRPIRQGDHVHTHNLRFDAVALDYAFSSEARGVVPVAPEERPMFQGIVRADGRVATRNYIGILTSVNCSATVAKLVAQHVRRSGLLEDYPNVDGVMAVTHGSGCGMAGEGEGFEILQRTLTGYAHHPNFAGVLVIGLGCEVNQISDLTKGWDLGPQRPTETMTIQEQGGTSATVRAAVDELRTMLPAADAVHREPVPASELVLGLECGGSDAYSGITANPALGAAADLLVRNGGTAVLGETPEVYGAEHLLTRRAVTPEVGERLVDRIRWWERYTEMFGGSMDNNPSPGNKEGGLTTILEKSLGAVAKGGTTDLVEVYRYAEPVTAKGFVFMDTPGYDPVSVTGMVAGGANVVCFTTGRGSVFGCTPTPSIKLCTNSDTYRRMADDMDVNCGVIIDGEADVEKVGRQVFELVLATASGRRSRSEELGFGEEEFTPWQLGAVM